MCPAAITALLFDENLKRAFSRGGEGGGLPNGGWLVEWVVESIIGEVGAARRTDFLPKSRMKSRLFDPPAPLVAQFSKGFDAYGTSSGCSSKMEQWQTNTYSPVERKHSLVRNGNDISGTVRIAGKEMHTLSSLSLPFSLDGENYLTG